MLHVFLAAAISTASIKPLFVPPKGMKRITPERGIARAAARERAFIVAQYRGFISVKPSWSNFAYKVPETITIAKHATDVNADEAGVRALTVMAQAADHVPASAVNYCAHHPHCSISIPKVTKLAAKPISLCNGQRGWLNEYTFGSTRDIHEQVYARTGNEMYVAAVEYPRDPGDALGAGKALTTLCPLGVGERRDPSRPLPMSSPAHWMRGVGSLAELVASPYKALAYWFYLAPSSMSGQLLALISVPDASEYVTPEQEAASVIAEAKTEDKTLRVQSNKSVRPCNGVDAWFTQLTGTDHGSKYAMEVMYAYGADTSYMLRYTRAPQEPEDPAAHKALYSLCPRQSPTQ